MDKGNKMHIKMFGLILLLTLTLGCSRPINEVYWGDENLTRCVERTAERHNWTKINQIEWLKCPYMGISNAASLNALTSLQYLDLTGNALTRFELLEHKALIELHLTRNRLTDVKIHASALTRLELSENALKGIDLSDVPALTELSLNENELTNLDLSKNTAMERLSINRNPLTEEAEAYLMKLQKESDMYVFYLGR